MFMVFHRFDTIPIALPEKYNSYNDTFYLDGCFVVLIVRQHITLIKRPSYVGKI